MTYTVWAYLEDDFNPWGATKRKLGNVTAPTLAKAYEMAEKFPKNARERVVVE